MSGVPGLKHLIYTAFLRSRYHRLRGVRLMELIPLLLLKALPFRSETIFFKVKFLKVPGSELD